MCAVPRFSVFLCLRLAVLRNVGVVWKEYNAEMPHTLVYRFAVPGEIGGTSSTALVRISWDVALYVRVCVCLCACMRVRACA